MTWRSGDGKPVYFRRGTSDVYLIYDILLKPAGKCEYWLPITEKPKIILDVGANIGIAARFFHFHFPSAQIHLFEPIKSNLEVLKKNIQGIDNCVLHEFGLASEDGEIKFAMTSRDGKNQGSFSAFSNFSNDFPSEIGHVKAANNTFKENSIDEIDILKIDAEGAEFDILAAMDKNVLAKTKWIVGELHSENLETNEIWRTLDYLSEWFDFEIRKNFSLKNFVFKAKNKLLD
ncbi:MAG: hypothetical protein A2077_02245 [Nitrospirae bacterium GWC2_46_6]|nr:MAG: hypothetical protein A2077_02245 [Nitrospirae bacterium GWC2_46_6]OGW21609.1 MAG: hypothetical protein A2Z82_04820 [Nitrospirae bacterium GWA2_46_11]OGW25235.1 MAG: hypothetical protein A2X55_08615 [Nitrospirae bacterium GWB2_47_37]